MRLIWGRWTAIGAGGIAVAAAIGAGASLGLASTTTPVQHRVAAPSPPLISIITTTATTPPPPTTTAAMPTTTVKPAPVNALAKAPETTQRTTTPAKPAPLPPVPGCEAGCQIVYRLYLAGDAHLDLMQTKDTPAGDEKGLMAYWIGTKLVDSRGLTAEQPQAYDLPVEGLCVGDQCVVSFNTGAHLSEADLLNLSPKTGITLVDTAMASFPGIVISDLNGDGIPDVSLPDDTYVPNFADGQHYWMTELNEDGHLVQTGCTTPVDKDDDPPAPTAPATGTCPAP